MKTNEIKFRDIKEAIPQILTESEKFSAYLELPKRDTTNVHLLTEEMITLMRTIVGDYNATLWFENEGKNIKICLTLPTRMDIDKREGLMSISTSGKNAAAKTLTAKLADMVEKGIEHFEAVEALKMEYGGSYIDYDSMAAGTSFNEYIYEWNLSKYEEYEIPAQEEEEEEDHPELERSIIGKIADDVAVGIKSNGVDVVITYTAKN